VLLAETHQQLQKMVNRLHIESRKFGMRINIDKIEKNKVTVSIRCRIRDDKNVTAFPLSVDQAMKTENGSWGN